MNGFKLGYSRVFEATFISRLNRFKCMINVNGEIHSAHIHDPGRLNELLKPNVKILVRPHFNVCKTDFYIFAVNSIDGWVLVDSAIHNKIFLWLLNSGFLTPFKGFKVVKGEFKFMNSRFDFLLESSSGVKMILEVKGCTLVLNGVAMFPDAPTLRGRRHVDNLIKALNQGYTSTIFILVTHPGARIFKPNWIVDEEFSRILLKAYELGVNIYVGKVVLNVEDMEINWAGFIPIIFT